MERLINLIAIELSRAGDNKVGYPSGISEATLSNRINPVLSRVEVKKAERDR